MVQTGYVTCLIIPGILILVFATGAVICGIGAIRDRYQNDLWFFCGLWSLCLVVCAGLLFAVAWPFDMQYHSYQLTSGTVKSVVTRQYAEDHGSTDYFGIEFTDGRIRKCNDMRCGLLKPGDQLKLWCVREYQFGPTDAGWGCDWNSSPRVKEGA